MRRESERARIGSGVYRGDSAQARERQVVAGENENVSNLERKVVSAGKRAESFVKPPSTESVVVC